jgi:hypothetical protein
MEQFFTPTRRLPDSDDFTEVQLAVSIESFMIHSWGWSDVYAFVKGDEGERQRILRIAAEDTFIFFEDENNRMGFGLHEDYGFLKASLTTKSGETHELVLATDRESSSLPASSGMYSKVVSTIVAQSVPPTPCNKNAHQTFLLEHYKAISFAFVN